MQVLLVGGDEDGAVVDCHSTEVSLTRKGRKYAILYEIYRKHPLQRGYKEASVFAVPVECLEDSMRGHAPLSDEVSERLHAMRSWRYLP